mmetsp:Transcript_17622/g.53742  ORF Transcript_17622/g.53742 Transcript_17622/m.53742 type:complete len:258 (-) Transcript_17622:464-1237(-)
MLGGVFHNNNGSVVTTSVRGASRSDEGGGVFFGGGGGVRRGLLGDFDDGHLFLLVLRRRVPRRSRRRRERRRRGRGRQEGVLAAAARRRLSPRRRRRGRVPVLFFATATDGVPLRHVVAGLRRSQGGAFVGLEGAQARVFEGLVAIGGVDEVAARLGLHESMRLDGVRQELGVDQVVPDQGQHGVAVFRGVVFEPRHRRLEDGALVAVDEQVIVRQDLVQQVPRQRQKAGPRFLVVTEEAAGLLEVAEDAEADVAAE